MLLKGDRRLVLVLIGARSRKDSREGEREANKRKDRTGEGSVLKKKYELREAYASLFRRFEDHDPIKRPASHQRNLAWFGHCTLAVKLSWLAYVVVKLVEDASSSGVSSEMVALKLPVTSLTPEPSVAVPATARRALVPFPTAVRMIGEAIPVTGEQDSPVVNPAQSVFELPGPNESRVILRVGSSGNVTDTSAGWLA